MALHAKTTEFLGFLNKNKLLRDKICAPPHQTMLYAGEFSKPAWKELEEYKSRSPIGRFVTLPDVLEKIPGWTSGQTLLAGVQSLEKAVPWKPDGFTIWRALSGIFASNAVGHVFFYVGSGIERDQKVFAATEIHVLARNPNIDPITKKTAQYLLNCVRSQQADINFGYLPINQPG